MLERPEIQGNKIIIPSDQSLIADVDEFVESRLRERSVDESTIADIAICATEMVNNGIIHGNSDDRQKTVTLELDFRDHEIVITVTDEGTFFDPTRIENPVDDANLMREVGRGIFIVRHLMDKVEIQRSERGGTMVTMTKKIT